MRTNLIGIGIMVMQVSSVSQWIWVDIHSHGLEYSVCLAFKKIGQGLPAESSVMCRFNFVLLI